MQSNKRDVRKYELYYADLRPVKGSEQGGIRPVLIIQNDIGNKYSPTTIVGIITSKIKKSRLPTHVYLGKKFGLQEESIILFEQMRTIDKERLLERIGVVDDAAVIQKINEAIHISMGLP